MSRFFVGLQPSSRGISAIAASHGFGVLSAAASSHLEHAKKLAALTVGAAVIAVAGLAASPAMAQDATNPQECQPGGYWYMQSGAGTSVPLACPADAALAESGGASLFRGHSPAQAFFFHHGDEPAGLRAGWLLDVADGRVALDQRYHEVPLVCQGGRDRDCRAGPFFTRTLAFREAPRQ